MLIVRLPVVCWLCGYSIAFSHLFHSTFLCKLGGYISPGAHDCYMYVRMCSVHVPTQ